MSSKNSWFNRSIESNTKNKNSQNQLLEEFRTSNLKHHKDTL